MFIRWQSSGIADLGGYRSEGRLPAQSTEKRPNLPLASACTSTFARGRQMPSKQSFRLYRDIILSEPGQPVWSAVGKISEGRFLLLGQLELYSKSDGALFLEVSQMGKQIGKSNRGKLDVLRHRRKDTDPHLFGFIKILEETYAAAAWMCRDDEDAKYLHLTLLKTKKPPILKATLSRSAM